MLSFVRTKLGSHPLPLPSLALVLGGILFTLPRGRGTGSSLSLSLSLSLCLCLFLCICLSPSLCFFICSCLFLSLSDCLYLSPAVCPFLSLCLSLSVCLSRSLSFVVVFCLCQSVSLSLCLCLCLPLCLSLPLSGYLIAVSVSPGLTVSHLSLFPPCPLLFSIEMHAQTVPTEDLPPPHLSLSQFPSKVESGDFHLSNFQYPSLNNFANSPSGQTELSPGSPRQPPFTS